MTPFETAALVVAIVFVVAYALKTSWGTAKDKVHLRVVQPRCATCTRFSPKAAQTLFRKMGAFTQLQQHLDPWEYFNPPKLMPNPEWEDLEAQLDEINEQMKSSDPVDIEGSVAELEAQRQKVLKRMAEVNEKLIHKTDPKDLPPEELELTWDDFGFCGLHKELRTKPDACESYTARDREARP